MAEALLRRRLDERALEVTVSSAGLLYDGEPATGTGVDTMAAWGLDISDHRSRLMTPAMLDGADLVVGMARQHVREAVVLGSGVYARTFTLKELVRRGYGIGARTTDESIADWLARAHD